MRRPVLHSKSRTPRRGFTLVELLIAIVILLFGVVAALRIFPPGFAAFSEAQQANIAQAQIDNWFNDLTDNADSLPDAILPVEPSATTAIVSQLNFHDLRAVDFIPGLTDAWAFAHRYTFGSDPWPLWQPLSARIPRLVVGEKVAIPADVSAFGDPNDTGNPPTRYNLPRFPTYIPRFAPIEANSVHSLLVYDLRYVNSSAPSDLTYSSGAGSFSFKDTGQPRFVRITYTCTDGINAVQVTPAVWRIDGTGAVLFQGRQVIDGQGITATVTPATIAGISCYTMTLNLPGGWSIVDGSEQLNRAYEYVDTTGLSVADSLAALQNMTARQFSLYTLPDPLPRYKGITKTLLSMLIFSKDDSGKTVKIDYVVADWSILHDDVTVDNNGYATLTTPPRLGGRPRFPRETQTWGLFEPMTGGEMNVVMTLFDLFSNNVFSVEYDPAAPNKDFGPQEKGYQVNTLVTTGTVNYKLLIDTAGAQQKRIRLGVLSSYVDDQGVTRPYTDWGALAGQTFRVYYRAQGDWTVQFFRAPREFGRASNLACLGWTNYTKDDWNNLYVPGIYAGQSIAVDYQHYDICQVTDVDVDSNQPGLVHTVDDISQVDIDPATGKTMAVSIGHLDTTTDPATIQWQDAEIVNCDPGKKTITLKAAVTPPITRGSFIVPRMQARKVLQRVSGEVCTIMAPNPNTGISRVVLKHLPAGGTVPTVRGASVVIRTLWTQPRSGEAYIVDDDSAYSFPTKMRTINERWREKTAVINLPVGGN